MKDSNPNQYDGGVVISKGANQIAKGANKFSMMVVTELTEAGDSREQGMLTKKRDADVSLNNKRETRRELDTLLVLHDKIGNMRTLIAQPLEL